MSKKEMKESIFNNTYRCVFCNHKGEWVTVYVKCGSFTDAFNHIKKKLQMWIIKEISERLEQGELTGKQIENGKMIMF